MEAKIKFIRHYQRFREDFFDVVYESGRVRTYRMSDLPAKAELFIKNAKEPIKQHDDIFDRDEFIYELGKGDMNEQD